MSRRLRILGLFAFLFAVLLLPAIALAQQTLGGITGVVTDATGGLVPGAAVDAIGQETGLKRSQTSGDNGYYAFVNLPIGHYTLTVTHAGFQTQVLPDIAVQADRTATLNVTLSVGEVTTSMTVNATPLMNAVDTTVGYVLDKAQLEAIPLPTGSFTGVAALSPGVNIEFSGGTGANSGLGNAPIWANGQRDTSNSFLINGVDASNLFNGKSTSQVSSFRVVNNTGEANNGGGGVVPSSASVYLAIGNAMPTPAPETIEEIRVNSSMYDAQEGSTSGAHIDMSTKSGTNTFHGSAYFHHGTNWLNAAPFFFKKDSNIPANDKNPQLHRYTAGAEIGGPIVKDKLFGFLAYQRLQISDQETGDELTNTIPGLSSTNRDPIDLANLINNNWTANEGISGLSVTAGDWADNPVGLGLFKMKNATTVAGDPGNWLIPNQTPGDTPNIFSPYNTFLPGTATFKSDQAVADLDWNASQKDTLSVKYYYQHDPSTSPYAYSNVPGFTAKVDAGSQVFSINNAEIIRSNFNLTETVAFLREKAYSSNDQPFTPAQVGMSGAFGTYFPGITINDALGDQADSFDGPLYGLTTNSLSIGPDAASQGSNTGVFQNRIMPSANAIWNKGKHTVTFGGSYGYTQLNVRDQRTGKGMVATPDMVAFAKNWVTPYSTQNFTATTFLQGNANRYYRANQLGAYVEDKFQATPTLSLTAGLRFDWNGGLTEKNGNLFNFNPALYQYNVASDSFTPGKSGFEIAGVNGVSNTTLTGRQWGLGPRIGLAWQPSALDSKLVVRAGTGIYYDRGELFTYLSPGYAAGEITGGPNGVNQTEPFVSAQSCPYSSSLSSANPTYTYLFYIPICGSTPATYLPPVSGTANPYNLATPWGSVRSAPPNNPRAADVANYLPNAAAIINGAAPFTLGVYNPANKLPYSINFTLNLQWQPRNDLLVELGYVGNLGRHQIIPVPFNQARIVTPLNQSLAGGANAQSYSYGYTVLDPNTFGPICVNLDALCKYGPMLNNYEGGNVDLRVPYVGYSSESESYTAAGISAYHALQAHIVKRVSHGFQAGGSYTYSHTTDEQSGLGLFYNGSNPDSPPYLRSGYGSADFDRTHVITFTYSYTLPEFFPASSLAGKLADSWTLQGITTLQSGQPYSVIDYSGAVGSLYYSTFDGITNPIVPLAPGCTRNNAKTGSSGAFYDINTHAGAALKANCFDVPLIAPGTKGVPKGDYFETDFTQGQRNIFRQSFQKRADASLVKTAKVTDQTTLRYTFDVFNLTNTTSFDIPLNNVTQNQGFNNEPLAVGSAAEALPTGCGTSAAAPGGLYNCPSGLGIVKHAIGSPRQIQMSLSLTF